MTTRATRATEVPEPAASGQDAAGDDAGDAGEDIPVDDGAADDDSSDAGDGGS